MAAPIRPRRHKAPGDPDCATDPLCCAPLGDAVIDADDAEVLALVLRALADPTRLRIVSHLRASVAGEACVGDLVEPLGLSQPTVSHHLRLLSDAGVLDREQRGKWVWYSVNQRRIDELRAVLA